MVKCINGKFHVMFSFLIARFRRKGFVLWTGLWHDPDTPLHRLVQPLVHWVYRHADALLVYGTHVRDHLLSVGVLPQRIILAPQAVDNTCFSRHVSTPELADVRRTMGGGNRRMILFVGRLEPMKGLGLLIEACAALVSDEWVVVVIGDGTQRRLLEERAHALLKEHVLFLGTLSAQELPAWYRSAAFLVLPSLSTPKFREPWGLVTNEAFNQACAVIVSAAVGAAAGGMVQHGVNGLVVPEADVPALTAAMERLLADRDLARRLGEQGRRTVVEWSHERMVEGFLEAVAIAGRRTRAGGGSPPFTGGKPA
jgi:glycosyltransferase involved in cell wall biosynthesis